MFQGLKASILREILGLKELTEVFIPQKVHQSGLSDMNLPYASPQLHLNIKKKRLDIDTDIDIFKGLTSTVQPTWP